MNAPASVALTVMYMRPTILLDDIGIYTIVCMRGGSPGVKQQINGNADYANGDPQAHATHM